MRPVDVRIAPPPVPRPPPPRPAPKVSSAPPSHTDVTSGGYNFGRVQQYNRKVASQPPTHTDITSSGGDYGSAKATAFKKTSPAYAKAVVDVFKAQPPKQQQAILQGTQRNPTPEGKLILNYLAKQRGATVGGGGLAAVTPGNLAGRLASQGLKLPSGAISIPEAISKTIGKTFVHGLGDVWNLPAGTVESGYGLGKELAGAHFGNAFHMLVDPYVQLAEHPLKTFEQHPVNSALMLMGPKSIIGKGAGAIARSGALGEDATAYAAIKRSPLHAGTVAGEPSPILEARHYSSDLINKRMQVRREQRMSKKGLDPNVAQPAPKYVPHVMRQAFNIGHEAKLNRTVDEMTAVRQMSGRVERAKATDTVLAAAKKHAPDKSIRNIASFVLQGIVRKPETAIEDLIKERDRLIAGKTGKRTFNEVMRRRQIRDLSEAIKHPEKVQQAFDLAAQIRPHIHTQDAYLVNHALLDPEQASRRALLPYAQTHMGAEFDPFEGKFNIPQFDPKTGERLDPKELTTDRIYQHLKDNGVPDPAYVGHFPGKASPGSFYSSYRLARGQLRHAFHGEALKKGAYDHTFEGLVGQVASRAEAVTRASLHDKVVNRLAIKMPQQMRDELVKRVFADARAGKRTIASARNEAELIRQGLFTRSEAEHFAFSSVRDDHGNVIPNRVELTPISTRPAGALDGVKDLQNPLELGNMGSLELRAMDRALEDAKHSTQRNVTLIPSVAAQRFMEQFATADKTMKGLGRVTQQFRRTVLPYSAHWMFQTGTEASLRGLLAGVFDPRYLRDGRALMKRLTETPDGRAALQEMTNATLYNKRDPLAVHNPNQTPISAAAHAFAPTRGIIAAHNRYANVVGHAMHELEHTVRLMGLGKLAHREMSTFGNSWANAVRTQGRALDQLAINLRNDPALVAKLGREIDDMFGKYNKFSPKIRAAVQSYAPFLPWYLTAARYVFWSLPTKHPVSSALMASLRQTLNQDMADGKQAPLSAWAMQSLARLTPFSIFASPTTKPSTGGFFGGTDITGAVLPQVQGSLFALAGTSPFGTGPLKGPHGAVPARTGPAAATAGENLLESLVPGSRIARILREGGKPSYATSTIVSPQTKKGEKGDVLGHIFNPNYSFERALGKGPAYGPKGTSRLKPKSSGSSSGGVPGGGGATGAVPGGGGSAGAAILGGGGGGGAIPGGGG